MRTASETTLSPPSSFTHVSINLHPWERKQRGAIRSQQPSCRSIYIIIFVWDESIVTAVAEPVSLTWTVWAIIILSLYGSYSTQINIWWQMLAQNIHWLIWEEKMTGTDLRATPIRDIFRDVRCRFSSITETSLLTHQPLPPPPPPPKKKKKKHQ